MQPVRGIFTSEFIKSLSMVVLAFLVTTGKIKPGDEATLGGAITNALTSLGSLLAACVTVYGYIRSRTDIKVAALEANASQPTVSPKLVPCIALGAMLLMPGPSYCQYRLLPWRNEVENRLKQLESAGRQVNPSPAAPASPAPDPNIQKLLDGQNKLMDQLAHPQIIYGPPQQVLPYQGAPQQVLPWQGAPQQVLPYQGAPQQVIPYQGAPQQVLPPRGPPQQALPPQGAPQQIIGAPQGPPAAPIPPQGNPQNVPQPKIDVAPLVPNPPNPPNPANPPLMNPFGGQATAYYYWYPKR